MTSIDVTAEEPWTSAHDRETAMRLAADEYARIVDLFERLSPEDWARPTDCPGWDVRDMAGHVLGMVQLVSSYSELVRQLARALARHRRSGGLMIDALTAVQVEKNATLGPPELIDAMRRAGPRAVRVRRGMPAFLRNRVKQEDTPGGGKERWTLGFTTDTILTRDPFMHRIDISRATGVPLDPTAEHEGRIVADVVQEWAKRHGRAYRLELTGAAGGSWHAATGGEEITMDALEFCRVLSGRAAGEGLLAVQVPF